MSFLPVLIAGILPIVILRITKKAMSAVGLGDMAKGGVSGLKASVGGISGIAAKAAGSRTNPLTAAGAAIKPGMGLGKKYKSTAGTAVSAMDKVAKYNKARAALENIKGMADKSKIGDSDLAALEQGLGTYGKFKAKQYKASVYRSKLDAVRSRNKLNPQGTSRESSRNPNFVSDRAALAALAGATQGDGLSNGTLADIAAAGLLPALRFGSPGLDNPVLTELTSSSEDALFAVSSASEAARAIALASSSEDQLDKGVELREKMLSSLRMSAGLPTGTIPVLADDQIAQLRQERASSWGVAPSSLLYHPLTGTFLPDPFRPSGRIGNHPVFKINTELATRAAIPQADGSFAIESDAEYADRLYSVLAAGGAISDSGLVIDANVFFDAVDKVGALNAGQVSLALQRAAALDFNAVNNVRQSLVEAASAALDAAELQLQNATFDFRVMADEFTVGFTDEDFYKAVKFKFDDNRRRQVASSHMENMSTALQAQLEAASQATLAAFCSTDSSSSESERLELQLYFQDLIDSVGTRFDRLGKDFGDKLVHTEDILELESLQTEFTEAVSSISREVASVVANTDFQKARSSVRSAVKKLYGDTSHHSVASREIKTPVELFSK